MSDRTLNIIHAIKQYSFMWDNAIKYYMSNLTGQDIEDYSESDLYKILKEAFLDYLKTCDNPSYAVRLLLEANERDGSSSIASKIASVLIIQQVKDKNGNFVNGFRELIKEI